MSREFPEIWVSSCCAGCSAGHRAYIQESPNHVGMYRLSILNLRFPATVDWLFSSYEDARDALDVFGSEWEKVD